jgi:hypothetical protein
MNQKRTIIALAVMMLAVLPMSIIMSDDSEASEVAYNDVWGEGFTSNSDGTLFIKFNVNLAKGDSREVTVVVTENGEEILKTEKEVTSETTQIELRFRLSSVGDHELTVTCTPAYLFPTSGGNTFNKETVTITVTESLWSKPTTYIAIIVVAVLIVIGFYMRMRNAPATKPDTTFTELERQQKESRGEVVEKKPKTSATERRRYSGGSESKAKEAKPTKLPKEKPAKAAKPVEEKKPSKPVEEKKVAKPVEEKKPSKPVEEKKAASFTELEKQKKDAAPKKEQPSGEPKKLKYVSSRRK